MRLPTQIGKYILIFNFLKLTESCSTQLGTSKVKLNPKNGFNRKAMPVKRGNMVRWKGIDQFVKGDIIPVLGMVKHGKKRSGELVLLNSNIKLPGCQFGKKSTVGDLFDQIFESYKKGRSCNKMTDNRVYKCPVEGEIET